MIRATGCRWLGLLAVFMFSAVTSSAQTVALQLEEQTHFLWQVKGVACNGYLLGSVHAAKADLFPLDPVIEEAFVEAEIIVFEVDMADLTSAALKMMEQGSLKGDETLQSILSPETYAAVDAFLAERGMNISGFNKVQPWFLALTMASLELQRAGYSPEQGIDLYFARQASKMEKQTLHLETIEEQLDLFAALMEIEGDEFLRQTLLEIETVIPLMDDVFQAWSQGRAEELERVLLGSFAEYPTIYKQLVLDRNMKWLSEIRALLQGSKDFMIVVGSLHMVGKDGLVEQLRGGGWTVEQR
ncbi:MAG: TraB/GumN family protein [bacterium]|nr:TraB/GumN family protein [bacterium]